MFKLHLPGQIGQRFVQGWRIVARDYQEVNV